MSARRTGIDNLTVRLTVRLSAGNLLIYIFHISLTVKQIETNNIYQMGPLKVKRREKFQGPILKSSLLFDAFDFSVKKGITILWVR